MKSIFTVCMLSVVCSCLSSPREGVPPTPGEGSAGAFAAEAQTPVATPVPDQGRRYAQPPASSSAAGDDSRWKAEPPHIDAAASATRNRTEAPKSPGVSAGGGDGVGVFGAATTPAARTSASKSAPASSGALADSSRSMQEAEAKDRPGLGTSWGENRYSSVTEAPFVRDGSRPSYLATMHYDDERGAAALAGSSSHAYTAMASVGLGTALTLSLRDEYGTVMSAYRGRGRTIAVGEHDQRYTIVVHNHTNERFEVVVSVDGLDVIDGRDAGYGKRGYLIEAFGIVEIDGFRQSDAVVAAFRFGAVRDSYAAQTGSARNVGVIGAAAFGERGYAARLRAYQERLAALRMGGIEAQRRIAADPFPSQYATPPLQLVR